ncbi:MAG: LPP20 family lipoprotein [Reichenbachiella sp.]|uniref:LPP20 family lipoprotein n=1 Tax=Reichenbachiella sp. TaxID=2184521 RepID=UPI00329A4164
MRHLSQLLFFLLIISTSSCATARIPSWIKKRPISDTHYIGIARVSVAERDFNQVAKNKALADIISEISVELSSTSVFHQLEENDILKDTYESWTKTKIEDDLEGYELVDTYTKKGEYWVYYQLNIAEYKRIKKEKLDKAKKLSISLLEKAHEERKKGEIGTALQLYRQSFDAITPHLNEDLSAFIHEHGRIDLANHNYHSIAETFANLSFRASNDPIIFMPLGNGELPTFTARYKDIPAKDLPLLIGKYGESLETFQSAKSNDAGMVQLPIVNVPTNSTQSIEIELDLGKIFGKKSTENIIGAMFSQKQDAPTDRINVKIEPQTAVFRTNTGGKDQDLIIKSAQSILTSYLVNKVSEESKAAFAIEIDGRWLESTNDPRYNLYRETLNFSVKVIQLSSEKVVYQTTRSDLKGVKSGSQMKAKEEALSLMETALRYEILPEINRIKID